MTARIPICSDHIDHASCSVLLEAFSKVRYTNHRNQGSFYWAVSLESRKVGKIMENLKNMQSKKRKVAIDAISNLELWLSAFILSNSFQDEEARDEKQA